LTIRYSKYLTAACTSFYKAQHTSVKTTLELVFHIAQKEAKLQEFETSRLLGIGAATSGIASPKMHFRHFFKFFRSDDFLGWRKRCHQFILHKVEMQAIYIVNISVMYVLTSWYKSNTTVSKLV